MPRFVLLLIALIAAPAMAQNVGEGAPLADPVPSAARNDIFAGDYLILGVGVAALPDYDGADEQSVIPAAGAIGRVAGIGFRLRGPSLTLDFIDDKAGSDIGFRLGPSVRLRTNRSGKVKDDVVDLLPQLKTVVEAGVSGGIGVRKVLTRQDSLSLGTSVRWDASGRGSGYVVAPGMSYLLPVSRGQVVGLTLSADWVSGKYARYDYSISPAASAASGLPAFAARGGFKEASLGAFTALDLTGDLLDGGFAVGVGALYTRLYGSAAKTPITSIRGSRHQWLLGAGIAHTF